MESRSVWPGGSLTIYVSRVTSVFIATNSCWAPQGPTGISNAHRSGWSGRSDAIPGWPPPEGRVSR